MHTRLRLRLGSSFERAIGTWSFLSHAYQQQLIVWKKLKAVQLAVLSFLPLLRGRKVLLHENNQAVVDVLSHLASRSLAMMDELRKLCELVDINNISIHR
jgi:hypothetical protein